jgi:hypothetical protein
LIALAATARPEGTLVRRHLERAFTECGLPEAMLMDHGIPSLLSKTAFSVNRAVDFIGHSNPHPAITPGWFDNSD